MSQILANRKNIADQKTWDKVEKVWREDKLSLQSLSERFSLNSKSWRKRLNIFRHSRRRLHPRRFYPEKLTWRKT